MAYKSVTYMDKKKYIHVNKEHILTAVHIFDQLLGLPEHKKTKRERCSCCACLLPPPPPPRLACQYHGTAVSQYRYIALIARFLMG